MLYPESLASSCAMILHSHALLPLVWTYENELVILVEVFVITLVVFYEIIDHARYNDNIPLYPQRMGMMDHKTMKWLESAKG